MTAGRMLRQGQRGRDVSQLQSALEALGYEVGASDGIFGPATHRAVMAFQRDQGLSADGIVGPDTFDALHSSLEALDDEAMGSGDEDEEEGEGTRWRVGERLLTQGTRGDDVAQLQEALDELGFDPGAIDGIFGPQTRRAVLAFQSDAELSPDGVVGPNTADALFEQLESSEGGGGSWDDDEDRSADEDEDEDDDDWDEDDDEIDPESWTLGERDLERGDKGSDVTELQELLDELDYEPGDLDGYFGPKTEASVLSFQEDHDLDPTGVVDSETLELLLEEAEREEDDDEGEGWDEDEDWDDEDDEDEDEDEDDDDDEGGSLWDEDEWEES